MLRNIMFKNLGFERLRITSPRLYLTKVKNFFFKKRGESPPSPHLGTVRARCSAKSNPPPPSRFCANLLRPGHRKKVRKKADKN